MRRQCVRVSARSGNAERSCTRWGGPARAGELSRLGALLLALALAQLAGAAQEGAAAGAPAPSAWKGRIPADPATYLEKLQEDFPTDEEEYQISPFIEVDNVTAYHFPKKTVPQRKIYAPKWEQDRERNFKHGPKTVMRHMLRPPGPPRGMFVIFDVPRDRDWGENATLFWEEPESDGSAPIRQYEMSWDRGVTWMRAGGSKSRHVRVGGLERGGAYPIMLRAYNKVGVGPAASYEVQNYRRPTYKQTIFWAAPAREDDPHPTPWVAAARARLAGDRGAVPILRGAPSEPIQG